MDRLIKLTIQYSLTHRFTPNLFIRKNLLAHKPQKMKVSATIIRSAETLITQALIESQLKNSTKNLFNIYFLSNHRITSNPFISKKSSIHKPQEMKVSAVISRLAETLIIQILIESQLKNSQKNLFNIQHSSPHRLTPNLFINGNLFTHKPQEMKVLAIISQPAETLITQALIESRLKTHGIIFLTFIKLTGDNMKNLTIENESIQDFNIHELTDENLNLLLRAQAFIKLKTGFLLSIQQLINEILNQFTTQQLTNQFIKFL